MSKNYYLKIKGTKVPVSKEVYYAYKQPVWREKKRKKVRDDLEWSADMLAEAGEDLPSEALVEELVAERILLAELFSALEELTEDERSLIDALYFEGHSERKYAGISGVPLTTINKRNKRVLEKLRQLISKGKHSR